MIAQANEMYKILGVSENATKNDIFKSFCALKKQLDFKLMDPNLSFTAKREIFEKIVKLRSIYKVLDEITTNQKSETLESDILTKEKFNSTEEMRGDIDDKTNDIEGGDEGYNKENVNAADHISEDKPKEEKRKRNTIENLVKEATEKESSAKEEFKKEESKKEESKRDEPKKEESKKEESKKDDVKKEESKKVEPKKDDAKKDESTSRKRNSETETTTEQRSGFWSIFWCC